MTTGEQQQTEFVSLSFLFVTNSMAAWTHALLEDRHCMDCKADIEGFDGAMVFSGQLPQADLVGHWCEACFERREEVREYQQGGR